MTDTLVSRDDGVVTITFNRPATKNSLSATNWNDLDRILAEVTVDPADRVVVLTGADGNFSSGADLSGGLAGSDISTLTGQPMQGAVHEMRYVNEIARRLYRLPKPTIAAVDGVCVGVAAGLATACDLIVASDRARFSTIFVRLGLVLDGGSSWSLPRQIGIRRAKQMAMFGDMVGAAQALDWGLVNEVVAPDELADTARAWAQRLADGPATALSLIKRMLDGSGAQCFEEALEEEARGQHLATLTPEFEEGKLAFAERRPPNFRGVSG